jgi:hypothetical protein
MDFLEMLQKEGALLTEREFSNDEREKLAKSGKAMSDGSFPIETIEDLRNAIQAHGRAKNPVAVKAHIKTRAKALGATNELPYDWKTDNESAVRGIFANVEQLEEAATTYSPSTGNLTITVIKPGLSKNNRYYSPELLKKSYGIFESAKMFADHQTDKEAQAKPEGSVRDWVGTITGVKCESDGTVKATANIHNEAFKTNLQNLKKAGNLSQMGISIRAFGEARSGKVGDKTCNIVESLLGCKSVDFVTFAAAGGQVESMSEAVDPADVDLMDIETLKARRPDLVKALTTKQTVTEAEKAARTIKKNNGADGKFVEGSPFNAEITTCDITETAECHDIFAKGDLALWEGMLKKGEITEAEFRKLKGQMSEETEAEFALLSEGQKAEFKFALLSGIGEADALRVVRITGGYGSGFSKGWLGTN